MHQDRVPDVAITPNDQQCLAQAPDHVSVHFFLINLGVMGQVPLEGQPSPGTGEHQQRAEEMFVPPKTWLTQKAEKVLAR